MILTDMTDKKNIYMKISLFSFPGLFLYNHISNLCSVTVYINDGVTTMLLRSIRILVMRILKLVKYRLKV